MIFKDVQRLNKEERQKYESEINYLEKFFEDFRKDPNFCSSSLKRPVAMNIPKITLNQFICRVPLSETYANAYAGDTANKYIQYTENEIRVLRRKAREKSLRF